jgi:hypothetical protein
MNRFTPSVFSYIRILLQIVFICRTAVCIGNLRASLHFVKCIARLTNNPDCQNQKSVIKMNLNEKIRYTLYLCNS